MSYSLLLTIPLWVSTFLSVSHTTSSEGQKLSYQTLLERLSTVTFFLNFFDFLGRTNKPSWNDIGFSYRSRFRDSVPTGTIYTSLTIDLNVSLRVHRSLLCLRLFSPLRPVDLVHSMAL